MLSLHLVGLGLVFGDIFESQEQRFDFQVSLRLASHIRFGAQLPDIFQVLRGSFDPFFAFHHERSPLNLSLERSDFGKSARVSGSDIHIYRRAFGDAK